MNDVITQAPRPPKAAYESNNNTSGAPGPSPFPVPPHPSNDAEVTLALQRLGVTPPIDRPEHVVHDPRAPLPAPGPPPLIVRNRSVSTSKHSPPKAQRAFRALLCCFSPAPRVPAHGPPAAPYGAPQAPPGALLDYEPMREANGATPVGYTARASEKLLLPPLRPQDAHKACLIVDLDETLVHSSFKPVKNPDFIIPVEIDGVVHQVGFVKFVSKNRIFLRFLVVYFVIETENIKFVRIKNSDIFVHFNLI